ncbi:hypothetical protein [Vibrio taketomensis]|uniref:hypothetical protein n=1 Tax=Vibrio taketomensis TaxID=2572923 RepID=UPI0015761F6D|nr:hypothetical protein [Vibrio taketomensis]
MFNAIQKIVHAFLVSVFLVILLALLINKPTVGVVAIIISACIYYKVVYATNKYNFYANNNKSSHTYSRSSSYGSDTLPNLSSKSTYEIVIEHCKDLETRLTKIGGTGKGLHEKTSSLSDILEPTLVRELRAVATIRNKLIHEEDFSLSKCELEDFEETAYSAFRQLRNFPALPKILTHQFHCPECDKTDVAHITMKLAVPLYAHCQHCGAVLDHQSRSV